MVSTQETKELVPDMQRNTLITQLDDFDELIAALDQLVALAETISSNVSSREARHPMVDQSQIGSNSKQLCQTKISLLTSKLDSLVAVAFEQDQVTNAILAYITSRGPGGTGLVGAVIKYSGNQGLQRYLTRYADNLSMTQLDVLLGRLIREEGVTSIAPYLKLLSPPPRLGHTWLETVAADGVETFANLGLLDEGSVVYLCCLLLLKESTMANRGTLKYLLERNPLRPEIFDRFRKDITKYLKG